MNFLRIYIVVLITLTTTLLAATPEDLQPRPIPPEIRSEFELAPFYEKMVLVGGLPIVGSAKLSDAALAECAWIVNRMLGERPDVLAAMAKAGVRFAVMAHNEYTTDIPEHSHLKPRVYWDRRARGLGATPSALAVSGAEENLLAFPGDPYPREIISIHEFAHAIHEMGMRTVDPTFDRRLRAAYDAAMKEGRWKGTYAATNRMEYWAEGVQSFFDNNDANNALHNDIDTREELQKYDPDLAALCAEVFGENPWRYRKPAERSAEDRAHLKGYDPAGAPRFRWRDEPTPERPRVRLDSAAGSLELEFTGPPESLERLLAQVHEGYYSSGHLRHAPGMLHLAPAATTPDGTAIPEDAGRWSTPIGEAAPGKLGVKIVKGEDVLARLPKEAEDSGIKVQRIVRLN